MKYLITGLICVLAVGCGSQVHLNSNKEGVINDPSSSNNINAYADGGASLGSICSWNYGGTGIGGIYSTLEEFKALVQSKVNSGQITHCVTVNGQMLQLTSPNGLFGPCMGAISQNVASYELWVSCASQIQ